MRYGVPISVLSTVVGDGPTEDPSLNLLLHLAAAYEAAMRLDELGAGVVVKDHKFVADWVERAYREAMHVRTRVPAHALNTQSISRNGRLVDASKIQNLFEGKPVRSSQD